MEEINFEKKKEINLSSLSYLECNNINSCPSLKKLNYILKLFKQYFLNKYNKNHNDMKDSDNNNNSLTEFSEIFNYSLTDYNIINLLNDFNHLKDYHLNYYNDINYIISSIDKCTDDNGKCRHFINEYREKDNKEEEQEKEEKDSKKE